MNCQDCVHLKHAQWHEEIPDYLCDGKCDHPDNRTEDLDDCPLEYDDES